MRYAWHHDPVEPPPDPEARGGPADPVPADVRRLWRLVEAPTAPGLSVSSIVAAAVDLADVDGFAAVTMARVARRLGNAPMSLYRHVTDKDELVALMMEAVSADPPEREPDNSGDGGWRPRLRRWAHALTALYLAHPWVLQVPVSTPPLGPGQLGWLDRGLDALRDTRISNDERMSVALTVLAYVRGQAVLLSQLDAPAPGAYATALGALVTADRFPALAALVSGDGPAAPESSAAEDATAGLELVLDGVAVLVDRR